MDNHTDVLLEEDPPAPAFSATQEVADSSEVPEGARTESDKSKAQAEEVPATSKAASEAAGTVASVKGEVSESSTAAASKASSTKADSEAHDDDAGVPTDDEILAKSLGDLGL
jgi:hypothetical protein